MTPEEAEDLMNPFYPNDPYLAIRTLINEPISFPNTTGCKIPSIGGQIIKFKKVLYFFRHKY